MTGSGKPGLITHVSRFDFSPKAQTTRINYQISQSKSARLEWSSFAGCSLYVRCGALVSLGMAVYVAVKLCGIKLRAVL